MTDQFDNKDAERELQQKAGSVKESDLERILEKRDEVERKFNSRGPLGRFVSDLKILYAMLQDYWKGNYRDVPWKTVAAVAGALLYVLTPLDVLPDFIPFMGLMDDATVMAVCLAMVEKDLEAYLSWKKRQVDT